MSLKTYRQKRTFKSTPEPKTKAAKSLSKKLPVFCVQKHAASHLHYDFRLECKDVMLSWAIPKGPSLDPSQKRLAVHVEDHPLEYRHFEGIIPEGNYGAGSVMIWDEGFFSVPGADTKKEIENALWQGFEDGHIEIDLQGEKLRGGYVLQRLKKDDDKNWLFMKRKDEYADINHDIIEQDRSVRTQRTINEISGQEKDPPKKKALKSINAPRKKMPAFIKPMLATLVKEPFDSDEWIFEIKWDGYRALARIDKKVDLLSRNEKSFNAQFSSVADDLSKLKAQVFLDGEIVILDKEGRSQFQLMQNYQRTKEGDLYYYVFDLLYLNGKDLRELPLIERKELLKDLIENVSFSHVRYSDHIERRGKAFFREATKRNLEGIMAKKMDSLYVSKRSRDWLKIKTHMRQEAVIGGYTEPRGGRKYFGALLLGVFDDKKNFIYIGHVGGGFDTQLLKDIYDKMQPLVQEKCLFKTKPKTNTPAVWLKPQLVCEVTFAEWTKDGRMRQPIFEGLRMDKKASTVKKEEVIAIKPKKASQDKDIKFSNLEKFFWPKLKLTKGDLIHYYQDVSDYILPYLRNRPVMLRRFPDGINDEGFIQKDTASLHLPSWIQTIDIKHENKTISYILIQDKDSLEYVVNLGTIEMHPFISQIKTPEYPDYFVIDLDPEAVEFEQVVETAQTIHEILDDLKVINVCKTSGKRGLHICIPMGRKYTFDQALQFGQVIAQYVNSQIPDITSLIRQPARRQKKVYLDVLQNHYKQTVIAPYSARGTEFATVSTPLKWTEVKKGLDPKDFNITNVPARLKKLGDIFTPVLEKGIDIAGSLKKLQKMIGKNE